MIHEDSFDMFAWQAVTNIVFLQQKFVHEEILKIQTILAQQKDQR